MCLGCAGMGTAAGKYTGEWFRGCVAAMAGRDGGGSGRVCVASVRWG